MLPGNERLKKFVHYKADTCTPYEMCDSECKVEFSDKPTELLYTEVGDEK